MNKNKNGGSGNAGCRVQACDRVYLKLNQSTTV